MLRKIPIMLNLVLRGFQVDVTKSRECHSTQIDLIGSIRNLAVRMRHFILEEDVVEDEEQPHITVFYGTRSDIYPREIREIIEQVSPFNIKCGPIGIFEKQAFDVVYVSVLPNEKLNSLNKVIATLPNDNEYDSYTPHITLAYVKKGTGKKYLTIPNLLEGKTFNVKQITISRVDYVNEIVNI